MEALTYADDMTFLSPTVLGIQRMLNTCTAKADNHSLLFNEKSTSIVFVNSNGHLSKTQSYI